MIFAGHEQFMALKVTGCLRFLEVRTCFELKVVDGESGKGGFCLSSFFFFVRPILWAGVDVDSDRFIPIWTNLNRYGPTRTGLNRFNFIIQLEIRS